MFAVLHIADFALQAVLRTESGLVARPAALFDGTTKKSLVLAANARARAAGVEPGMTAPLAVARCPALVIRTARPDAEADARAALLAAGFTLSPTIEETAPGICTLDLKGTAATEQVARVAAAVGQLDRLGLPATAGIARTPLLALYAARATDSILKIADEASFLAPLPIAVADPSPRLAEVFTHWGLRTLGDFTMLPRDEIVRRFGAEGLALWNRATGGGSRPLKPVAPPQTFSAAMEFEQEIETLEPLLFILRRLLDRLTLELQAAHYVAAELELRLSLDDETHHVFSLRLPEPTSDEEILFRALFTKLESLRTDASIAAVHLRIAPARPLVRQQGLFETGLRDPHGFAETLARIAAIVGSERVGTPRCEDTHRPDVVRLMPPPPVIPPAAAPPLHTPLGLPLRRLRPPLPVKLELSDQQPTYVWTEHFHGAIAHVRGPWFSDGGWWQKERTWSRVEWDIALEGGGLYRLSLVGQVYFIEGEYD